MWHNSDIKNVRKRYLCSRNVKLAFLVGQIDMWGFPKSSLQLANGYPTRTKVVGFFSPTTILGKPIYIWCSPFYLLFTPVSHLENQKNLVLWTKSCVHGLWTFRSLLHAIVVGKRCTVYWGWSRGGSVVPRKVKKTRKYLDHTFSCEKRTC